MVDYHGTISGTVPDFIFWITGTVITLAENHDRSWSYNMINGVEFT